MEVDGKKCKRYKIRVDGSDYYLVYGADICMVKMAYEHRAENDKLTAVLGAICAKITDLKQEHLYFKCVDEEE